MNQDQHKNNSSILCVEKKTRIQSYLLYKNTRLFWNKEKCWQIFLCFLQVKKMSILFLVYFTLDTFHMCSGTFIASPYQQNKSYFYLLWIRQEKSAFSLIFLTNGHIQLGPSADLSQVGLGQVRSCQVRLSQVRLVVILKVDNLPNSGQW